MAGFTLLAGLRRCLGGVAGNSMKSIEKCMKQQAATPPWVSMGLMELSGSKFSKPIPLELRILST